jgi:succinyl-CoA synthetase alpha subunit
MSILIDKTTRVLVQGITGKEGSFWTGHMIGMGTNVVAGSTPNKEGQVCCGAPVYHSVRRALEHHPANASMVFVPPRYALDAVMEALDNGIKLIVTLADGIPLHDQARIRAAAIYNGARVIGGNTSGIISPGKAMMGSLPYWIQRVYRPGRIGIMTRSGSLTNEVTAMVVSSGFGVSSLIGVGGDPIPGTRFAQLLDDFEKDKETDAVVIIGELGGTMEEEAAEALHAKRFSKPLVAFLSGRTAPPGTRMGHAGAIINGTRGTVDDKTKTLENAGARVALRPREVGVLLKTLLGERNTCG